jgi:hypothetical protein
VPDQRRRGRDRLAAAGRLPGAAADGGGGVASAAAGSLARVDEVGALPQSAGAVPARPATARAGRWPP